MFGEKKSTTPSIVSSREVTLEQIIEALLFYTAKELTFKELSSMSGHGVSDVKQAVVTLQNSYANKGINIIVNKQKVVLVTSQSVAGIITKLHKDEENKPLSKAALETLSIVAYNGPVTRPEIDYIRGVNSTYSLRNLLIRGLIDKTKDGATVFYTPSMDTYRFMGITAREELPDFAVVTAKVAEILQKKIEEEGEIKTEEENPSETESTSSI